VADGTSGRLARERSSLVAEHSSHVTEQDLPVGGQIRGERMEVQEGRRLARERPAAALVELPDRSQLGQQRVEPVEILVANAAQAAVRRRRQANRSS
jgi:hypothetical protein